MSSKIALEMNFCRRCGSVFNESKGHVYTCEGGHTVYSVASSAVGVILEDKDGKIVILHRARNPGIGRYDLPGGFCDGAEPLEDALAREIKEEIGLTSVDYTTPIFVSSGIDPYEFGGETIPSLASVFYAKLLNNPTLVANDDAASVELLVPTKELIDQVFFPALRKGLTKHYLLYNESS